MVLCPGCGEENPPKFRLCGYCGTPLAAAAAPLPAHEVRKTVTIVFSDLKGSTALGEKLDAEALHEVKSRYFNAMAAEIARHGGKVEKYIGDAIMAVFGLPRAHEDDALRAVRAAVGMRAALDKVNADLLAHYGVTLANRTGVATGEVVANDDPGATQKLATGDAVNVAARLEQAAPENQIYLGELTYRLVRDAVEAEAVEALELKGKAQRVAAWRLQSARGLDGNLRRSDTPIVGRDAELAEITRVYREVVGGRAVRLVTVFGDAGVGKSRLMHEVLERITRDARVLRGRCLAYGEGITFWPLRVMLGAAGVRDDDSPEAARAKMEAFVGDREVVDRLAAATGLSATTYPLHEVYWAARKVLEILAAAGPVVALIDDIHWAEPAFLDLLDHVLETSKDAPILLLATARHDLLEERADWGDQPGALNIALRPLTDDDAAQVITNLLGQAGLSRDVLARIVSAAEGNPLYVEQMLSMLIDSGALQQRDGRWVRADAAAEIHVPPTIQALIEARLDRLGRAERAAVEPASVIGLEFAQPAVQSLVPEPLRPGIHEHMNTLTRKQLIRLSRAVEAEPIYRFQHQLVRDTVYNGLLKRARAQLHIEFVRWADKVNADRQREREFEEILGYHLEQAHRCLRELGPLDETGRSIGRDAAKRLASAGKRALARGDAAAAANLYRRAVALLESDPAQRLLLLPTLGEVHLELGEFDLGRAVCQEAAEGAAQSGDERVAAASRLVGLLIGLYSGAQGDWGEQATRAARETMPLLERLGADEELANSWRLIALAQQISGRHAEAAEAIQRVIHHARSAGHDRLVARSSLGLSFSALFGPTPVPQAIAHCEEIIATGLHDRQVESLIKCKLAQLRAMNGEFEVARRICRQARALLRELGHGVQAASTGLDLLVIELLAGDLAGAESEVSGDYAFLEQRGETYYLSTMAALLSRVVRDQGRDGEALELSHKAQAAAAKDDLDAQVLWRSIRAPIVARSGATDDAEAMAREALSLLQGTETPILRADALSELASVLSMSGRDDDSRAALQEAITLYRAKGDVVSAGRVERALRRLPDAGG